MTIQDAIKINTTSWGKAIPQLNENNYREKYNYQITITRLIVVIIVYFFLLGIFSWVKVFFMQNHYQGILTIDFNKAGKAILLLLMYFSLLITGYIWIYDRENNIHNKDTFIYPIVTIGLSITMILLIMKSYF